MSEKAAYPGLEIITSRQNPLVSTIRKVASSRSFRRQNGLFLCDGVKMLEEAIRWQADIRVLVSTREVRVPPLPGVRQVQVPSQLMSYLSPMESPQGVLFLCGTRSLQPPQVLEGEYYLVLDGLQDPGNVGTIWRTADAFGAQALILTGNCADPYNSKTVRATMGAIFRLPVYKLDIPTLTHLCHRSDLPLYATALGQNTVTLGSCDLGRAAVVIGNEGKGVCGEVLAACEKTIRIPMEPRCESLNAAVAASVMLWELYRNRQEDRT